MSHNTDIIRTYFAITGHRPPRFRSHPRSPLLPQPGQILWITGPSGSGKSKLLRQMRSNSRLLWIDVNRLRLPDLPVVDCFGGLPLEQTLPLLSRMGLAEVWTYLRRPRQLSTGQRFRLRLAVALARAARWRQSVILCDEFAANLDPLTAAIVAHCFRRALTPHCLHSAILAGARDDFLPALRPDRTIECDFGIWNDASP